MRICFSMIPQVDFIGGGGSKVATNFANFLIKNGVQVEVGLDIRNMPDLIFMFDPRPLSHAKNWLTLSHIRELQDKYKISVPIVHRINDTDKHSGRPPNFVESVTELANRSKKVIYVSDWVRQYYKNIETPSAIIHNGVNKDIFNMRGYVPGEKLKLVTHHWSTNIMKGWDYYKKIDEWLGKNPDVQFTVIGRKPAGLEFKNAIFIPAKTRKELVLELQKSNVYITASKYEACGNHYIEGVSCGLPLLFHEEGGGVWDMKEYGLSFSSIETLFYQIEKFKQENVRKRFYDKIVKSFDFYEESVYRKYLEVIYEVVG